MKLLRFLKTIPLIAVLVSPTAYAWENVTQSKYAVYGTRIEQSKDFLTPFAEVVYDNRIQEFGITFIDSKGKRKVIPYGIFNMRVCGSNTQGAIVGTALKDSNDASKLQAIFTECKRPMFLRVWDTDNEHVTYKFENTGPLKKAN